MKKLIILVGIIVLIYSWLHKPKANNERVSVEPQITQTQKTEHATNMALEKSIFVPYWSITNESLPSEYTRYIYFGISANKDGVNREEPGYTNLNRFDSVSDSIEQKYLTLRLLDANTNIELLSNTNLQKKIINETITIANEYGYDGVVLDLELSILPIVDMTAKINTFVQDFYLESQNNNMGFSLTMYGDAFYRNRPFDIKFMAKHSDEVMVMAYDFSKSYGEPGPNFPAQGKEEYGYDFETMVKDFTEVVPEEKLSIIFGMYGYDWTLGAQGKPLTRAEAITLNQLNNKYAKNCQATNCVVKRDELSGERIVAYHDNENNHIIWSEDEESVEKKIDLLNGKFSGKIIYWAYGYF